MVVFKRQTEIVEQNILDRIICDVCKKDYYDDGEINEFHNIRFIGGYKTDERKPRGLPRG